MIEGGVSVVVGAAILSSTLSIAAAVFDFISKRKFLKFKVNRCVVDIKVTSQDPAFEAKRKTFSHQTQALAKVLAEVCLSGAHEIELQPMKNIVDPEDGSHGLQIRFVVSSASRKAQ